MGSSATVQVTSCTSYGLSFVGSPGSSRGIVILSRAARLIVDDRRTFSVADGGVLRLFDPFAH